MAKWIPERLGIRSADIKLDLWKHWWARIFDSPPLPQKGQQAEDSPSPESGEEERLGRNMREERWGRTHAIPSWPLFHSTDSFLTMHSWEMCGKFIQLEHYLFIFFNQGMLVHHNRNLFWKDASFHETVAASSLIRALTSGVGDWTDVHNL